MVREILPNDYKQANRLLRQLYPELDELADFSARHFKADYFPLCYERDGKLLGMALGIVLRFGRQPQAYIEEVVVDRRFRGRGIGTQLVSSLMDIFRQNGVSVVFVPISYGDDENDPRSFYAKFGFRQMRNAWLVKMFDA